MSNSWIWADFGLAEWLTSLFAFFVFCSGVWSIGELRRLALADEMISGKELFSTFAAFPIALLCGWWAYSGAKEHRLLRGECRYTAARVYENWRYKGDEESRFEFWVAGQRYRFDERMSWRGGWRALHSRWYVRYAVPDPDVYEYLDRPVPDSVRVVPANGWATLPEKPRPPASATPAPATVPATSVPVPLTGPDASPVFRPVPADSVARSLIGPLATPSPVSHLRPI